MLATYDSDLQSAEGRLARNAISNLGRLGGDEAKAVLDCSAEEAEKTILEHMDMAAAKAADEAMAAVS